MTEPDKFEIVRRFVSASVMRLKSFCFSTGRAALGFYQSSVSKGVGYVVVGQPPCTRYRRTAELFLSNTLLRSVLVAVMAPTVDSLVSGCSVIRAAASDALVLVPQVGRRLTVELIQRLRRMADRAASVLRVNWNQNARGRTAFAPFFEAVSVGRVTAEAVYGEQRIARAARFSHARSLPR